MHHQVASLPQVEQLKQTKSKRKFSVKKTFKGRGQTAIYVMIVMAVISISVVGSRMGSEDAEPIVTRVGEYTPVATLDEVSAADVAATIARDANLLIADNVRNKADSLTVQTEFSAAEGTYLEKPQIIATDAKTKAGITEYVAQEGDTLDKIARRFNITTNTIKWANDLSGSKVSKGRKLTISPISGVIYTVKSNDTAKSIAEKYSANAQQIIAFNDAEIDGLKKGQKIVIPDGKKPAPVVAPVYIAAGPTAPRTVAFSFGSQPLYGGNGYSYGYCTWHAANRRLALGLPMPRNLGNAVTWASLGGRAGMSVGGVPIAGAILWDKRTYLAGGLGHVAFVEKVNADGSIGVSDMNYPSWGVATYRTVPKAEVGNYLFIN